MRLSELLLEKDDITIDLFDESDINLPTAFWINCNTNNVINVEKSEHILYLVINYNEFNIPKEKIENILKRKFDVIPSFKNKNDIDTLINDISLWEELLYLANDYNWVRGRKISENIFGLQSKNVNDIRKVTTYLNKHTILIKLYIDKLINNHTSHDELNYNQINHFIKYGKISNNIYECVMKNKSIIKEFINENKNNNNELLLEKIVKSSWILRLDYVNAEDSDEEIEYVEMQTKKGSVYRLYEVPKKIFNSWLRAPSKGKFWWRKIAGTYIAERY